MIQRIQSLYLLFAAVFSVTVFVVNFGVSTLFSVFAVLCTIISVVSIFLYKNRKLQIKICYTNIILQLFALSIVFVGMLNGKVFKPLICPFILGANCALVAIAIISIQKDEKLIKSLDRIR